MLCHSTPFSWAAPFLFIIGCSQALAGAHTPPKAAMALVFYGNGGSKDELLCLGDSIRIGWAAHLPCTQPKENCQYSRYALEHLDEWTGRRHYHIIVFNFGLHDIRKHISLAE